MIFGGFFISAWGEVTFWGYWQKFEHVLYKNQKAKGMTNARYVRVGWVNLQRMVVMGGVARGYVGLLAGYEGHDGKEKRRRGCRNLRAFEWAQLCAKLRFKEVVEMECVG